MRISYTTGALAATAFALLGGTAAAQNWSDNFDSYNHGDMLETVGAGNGWESWSSGIPQSMVVGLPPAPTANSLPNCMDNVPGVDTVNNYGPGFATSGQWIFDGQCYIPTGAVGRTYFIMLNTYQFTGPYNWSVQAYWDMDTNLIDCDCAGNQVSTTNMVRDQWVEFRAEIDLDADLVDIFYDNISLTGGVGYAWTGGVFGGGSGLLEIQALDLFPASATGSSMYYDDLRLRPEMGPLGTADAGCVQLPDSTGGSPSVSLFGTGVAGDAIEATVTGGKPGEFGYWISGPNTGLIPAGCGFVCIGNPQYRYNNVGGGELFQFDAGGTSQTVGGSGPNLLATDGTGGGGGVPAILAGETRSFQGWFRDDGCTMPNQEFNFTDSLIVTFL